jgi:PelA/Pel-15E family pectate lyase
MRGKSSFDINRRVWLAALFGAMIVLSAQFSSATVVSHSVAAESLTAERISVLPSAQRAQWMSYLERSSRQEMVDRASLAAERKHVATVPAEPPLAPSVRSMPMNREDSWYGGTEAKHIADVIISFQIPSGGWGKNMNMAGPLRQPAQSYVTNNANRLPSAGDFDAARDPSWHYVGTIDNDATTTELRFLAKVQAHVSHSAGEPYRKAFLRGVNYLLAAQYPNGGWPQVWPLEGGYHDAITFNDDAMNNAIEMLSDVSERKPETDFLPGSLRAKAAKAVSKGIECILATQVVLHGRRTVWGQQYDPLTLRPVAARNYEPASLSSEESADLLVYLMNVKAPSPQLRAAVNAGVTWLREHAIYNEAVTGGRNTPEGRRVIAKQGGGPIWARYYSLESEKPIFGDRDKTIHDDMNEISRERRNGYAWFNEEPAKAIQRYEEWGFKNQA